MSGWVLLNSSTISLITGAPKFSEYTCQKVISTGSPANLDAGHPDKLYIHPGDVIRCEIAGIGSLTNPVEVRQDREERL